MWDNDTKFGAAFDDELKRALIDPHPLPFRAPNLNAHAERFIQTLQMECLDRFIVLGTGHLDHLVQEYVDYYNRQRPHSAIEFKAPAGVLSKIREDPPHACDIRCEQRLGGLIRHYHRRAA